MSKNTFYLRDHIVKFILSQGFTPSSAFMMYSYFLLDTVGRQALISANNQLVRRSDELWIFGPISTGVQKEIDIAKSLSLPVKYFKTIIDPICGFEEIEEKDTICELS